MMQNNRSRRTVLLGAGSLLVGGIASPALATPAVQGPRSVAFNNLHTGECLKTEYWVNGGYVPEAVVAICKILRDFRTGDVHPIDVRLIDLLNNLQKRLDTQQPFAVISGYRSPATNAMLHARSSSVAPKSLHMQGMAIDVRVPGRSLKALHQAALGLRGGGVGYYPVSDFVHVDVGAVRRWKGT